MLKGGPRGHPFCIYYVKIIKKSLSLPLMGAVRDTGFDV